jgi:dCMP deaminase
MSRLRPSWDSYFMSLADLAARRSNCMKRRVGCVLVRGARVISTGYNGTPRGATNCNEGGCPRCNAGEGSGHSLSNCLCLHAEVLSCLGKLIIGKRFAGSRSGTRWS